MLYSEFIQCTGAVENQATYDEYKRVELIYMESDHMTKEDAYRMAKVETVKQYEARQRKARKAEIDWVKQNIIPAAAFVRGIAERNYTTEALNFWHRTPCNNLFELRMVRNINGGSVVLYEFFVNGKKIDTESTGYTLLPSAEIQSYRADWHDKTLAELEDLFGYIA